MIETLISIVVDEEGEGERLDRYLASQVPVLSRTRIQKLLALGSVTVDGAKPRASSHLRCGERIELAVPVVEEPVPPERGEFPILYEDEEILVLDKPAGLTVHPVREGERGTLVNLLRGYTDRLSGLGGALRPGIVHRLDKETSGVMVVAKTDRAHKALTDQLQSRSVEKEYVALVLGNLEPPRGEVTAAIGRDAFHRERMAVRMLGGKPAETSYEEIERLGRFSWVRLKPRTGRTHQIRVHMAYLGHPVAGDKVYGPRLPALAEGRFAGWQKAPGPLAPGIVALLLRQALHSRRLAISHPASGARQEFEAVIPDDMRRLIEAVRLYEAKAG